MQQERASEGSGQDLSDMFEFGVVIEKEREPLIGDVDRAVTAFLAVLFQVQFAATERVELDLHTTQHTTTAQNTHDEAGRRQAAGSSSVLCLRSAAACQ
jgi:hypothetical protein